MLDQPNQAKSNSAVDSFTGVSEPSGLRGFAQSSFPEILCSDITVSPSVSKNFTILVKES